MKKLGLFLFAIIVFGQLNAQYTTTNIVSGLAYPVCLDIAPDGRFFVSLKGGGNDPAVEAQIDVYNSDGTFQATLWDFTDSTQVYFERGVLGVELDPDFDNNHYVYVFYNHRISTSRIRVVRFTETNGVGSNPTMIFDIADPHTAGNHTGGNIHFGPDGKLYISIGDRATQANSQDITNNPFGKLLRLNADGTIPTDNPFYDDGNPATGNDDRIWCYGLRNTFDFTFSTVNDSLYATENGLNTWDEVNLITKGGNYGWNTCEGFFNQGSTTVDCSLAGAIDPLDDWGAPLPAVTGVIIYDHSLMPEFTNHMLVVDYNDAEITDFTLGNAPAYDIVSARSTVPITTLTGLTDIVQGNEGCLYVIRGGYTTNGRITRICPSDMSVEEPEQIIFSVYPNPSNGTFEIVLNQSSGEYFIHIADITGRNVFTKSFNSNEIRMDLQHLSKGVYTVSIEKEGKISAQKIIIE